MHLRNPPQAPKPIPFIPDFLFDPLQQSIQQHIQRYDSSFELRAVHAIGGGCISRAMRFDGHASSYFIKLNTAEHGDMFAAEAAGLDELAQAKAVRVPRAICHGVEADTAFLVCEWLDLSSGHTDAAVQLGRQLAQLHRCTQQDFGWKRDNTIGATPQINTPESDWCAFWREHRLGFQLKLGAKNGFPSRLLNKGERLMGVVDVLLAGHQAQASLLHGDLWGGNWGMDETGAPVLFDPAVYYGDREADIAMTELFGGFPGAFYAAYRESWPLDDGYALRKTLYNLYHILNHFNLFGGGYAAQAESMMDSLLAEMG